MGFQILDSTALFSQIQTWAQELGFSQIGATGVDLSAAEPGLLSWLANGFHGDMVYMSAHGLKRARPAELVPGTVSVLTARMDYLPSSTSNNWTDLELQRLQRPNEAIVSVYARGRDYHKVMRNRLQEFAQRIEKQIGSFGYRVFTDSAPLMEVELARKAGLGWRGKHTLLLNRESGSTFFLGEILVDVPLPIDEEVEERCGTCTSCIDVCPTQAITAPYQLDARRCISYLTIENPDAIPVEFRQAMGNRVYGCDDCQLICPWNKFAKRTGLPDFARRHGLGQATLLQLWSWTEAEFEQRHEGSAIRRIGYSRWRRNLAVAMGNALANGAEKGAITEALNAALPTADPLVAEHIEWALGQNTQSA